MKKTALIIGRFTILLNDNYLIIHISGKGKTMKIQKEKVMLGTSANLILGLDAAWQPGGAGNSLVRQLYLTFQSIFHIMSWNFDKLPFVTSTNSES